MDCRSFAAVFIALNDTAGNITLQGEPSQADMVGVRVYGAERLT